MTTAFPNRAGEGSDHCDQLLGQSKQQEDATLNEAHTSLEPDHGFKTLTFNSGPRPYRDTIFTFLFISTVLITYAFGIFAVKNAHFNPESQYNPTTGQCEVIKQHAHAGNTSTHAGSLQSRPDPFNMAVRILVPILATSILTTPMGFFILWMLHRYTRRAVVASLPLQCFFPLAFLLSAFTFCSSLSVADSCWNVVVSPNLGLAFVVSVLLVWMLSKDWSSVGLVVQVLKSSLHVLRQNLCLLMLYPIWSLVVILIDAPIITFIVYATYNGKISPDFESSNDGCNQTTGPPCCQFKQAGWAIAYFLLAVVAAVWVMAVTIFLQHFVVSGTIAEWYAAPPGASTVGFTKRSLRNALGPSFGTICVESATFIFPILQILNCLTPNWACFTGLHQLVAPFSFRIRQDACEVAAISGESFFKSARNLFDLSQRQSTFNADIRLVDKAITGMAFLFSSLHFLTIFGAMYYFSMAGGYDSQEIALLCGGIMMAGLITFHSVISEGIFVAFYCTLKQTDQYSDLSQEPTVTEHVAS